MSLDVLLGAPFNIASYSLILGAFSEASGKLPGTFHHHVGDCHIYEDHIEQMKEQVDRDAFPSPTVVIKESFLDSLLTEPVNAHDLDFAHWSSYIKLLNYESHAAIKGEVAV